MRRRFVALLCFAGLPACGDDGSSTSADTTSGTSSGGPTSTTEPGTSTSTPTSDTSSESGSEESTDGGESTSGSGSSSTGAAQLCGNGVTDDAETCDDGNTDDDDSCNADCSAATCLVPVTHATVQAGADDAGCPTVWIMPGTYDENLTVTRDAVFERVLDDPAVLDGNGERTVDIGGGDVTLRGLTVTGGESTRGAGIGVADAVLTLDGTTVEGNTASAAGGGVLVVSGTLHLIGGSAVTNNRAADQDFEDAEAEGGGIFADVAVVTIADSTLSDNEASADISTGDGIAGSARALGGGLSAVDSQVFITAGGVVSGNTAATICSRLDQPNPDVCVSVGGAIRLQNGSLVVADSAVDGNTAQATSYFATVEGGALLMQDDTVVSISRSSISMNLAQHESQSVGSTVFGGAIFESSQGTKALHIADVTATGNSATAIAGADTVADGGFIATISGALTLRIERSTFEGNTADATGGAARLFQGNSDMVITNSTFSANASSFGGAISYVPLGTRALEISSSTFTHNTATDSGGALLTQSLGTIEIRNSIVYGNTATNGPDCITAVEAPITSAGYNFIGDTSACSIVGDTTGNQIGVDPQLGALMDNGGPTPTHALSPTSLAVNAGNPVACVDDDGFFLATDQRGESRHAQARCDVGSYEYQP